MENKINNIDKFLGVFEKIVLFFQKYKVWDVLKALMLSIIIGYMIYFAIYPEIIFEKIEQIKKDIHIEDIEYRLSNNEKLHLSCEKLLLKVQADRVMLLEVHNSGSNLNGLPFVKCSAIYESMSDSVYPLSEQYQNIQLSLLPFSTLLFKQKYYCGDVDSLIDIDRNLYYKMKGNCAEHFASCVVTGIDNKPLAFLFVTYQTKPNHNCKEVKEIIKATSNEIAILLELQKR